MQLPLSTVVKVGRQEAIKCVSYGVITGYLIMSLLWSGDGWINGFRWIFKVGYIGNILVGILGMYVAAYFVGPITARLIVKKLHTGLTGITSGFLILWFGIFTGSSVELYTQWLRGNEHAGEVFHDHLFKPWFWISVMGAIPVLFTGIWCGHSIKDKLDHIRISLIENTQSNKPIF
ncbi:MAG: hypothetical protein J7497_14795 [Chitinophagaceae bacterium]|nr:hypothetical protein [Chitinophagaceae bacterium]